MKHFVDLTDFKKHLEKAKSILPLEGAEWAMQYAADVSILIEEIERLERENAALRAQVDGLKERLAACTKAREDLDHDWKHESRQNSQLRAKVELLRDACSAAKRELLSERTYLSERGFDISDQGESISLIDRALAATGEGYVAVKKEEREFLEDLVVAFDIYVFTAEKGSMTEALAAWNALIAARAALKEARKP